MEKKFKIETYDPEGIIDENDFYIYYQDKIWSKTHNNYLKSQKEYI